MCGRSIFGIPKYTNQCYWCGMYRFPMIGSPLFGFPMGIPLDDTTIESENTYIMKRINEIDTMIKDNTYSCCCWFCMLRDLPINSYTLIIFLYGLFNSEWYATKNNDHVVCHTCSPCFGCGVNKMYETITLFFNIFFSGIVCHVGELYGCGCHLCCTGYDIGCCWNGISNEIDSPQYYKFNCPCFTTFERSKNY